MEEKRTSSIGNGLVWFGAAVSIAEILTGTYIAPLGMKKGMAAILLGHLIGCTLFCLAGLIGGHTRKSSMETVKLSFGSKGALLFAVLNILQLVGWTAIMIINGAQATAVIAGRLWGIDQSWIWCLAIGAFIILWIAIGIKNIDGLNYIAMGALFILTIVLSMVVFKGSPAAPVGESLSFGAAVELSAAMPLSWLPLISDYTREAKKPGQATVVSTLVYFAGSTWMYAIGLGAAIFTGETDISKIMLQAGIGIAGVVILIVSTVTTTFLDSYSAGVSASTISQKMKQIPVGIAVAVVGILLAILTPIQNFENFLYLIGSVFAPMITIQIADYFILKRNSDTASVDWVNLILWGIGFLGYRVFMKVDTPVGQTLPVMLAIVVLCVIVRKAEAVLQKRC
ncbi:putative hydroxymethylpyrimidine transporter CytX [Clostridium sp. C105KSO13]|uniref:putative hydroxymethylpyrimidine transporter CytX n=1 Tax=Clostridium sp. C105KSO13 TaxID=1776045 RepID=UPI000740607C|nr:putative hydroxymethylpyrimidine transporter CytX [Clostridium sp. C105KSO13]CUX41211.1 Cytosine permease [Clostridium sp. C105KSO13]